MVLNMKERNAKKAQVEFEKLKKDVLEKRAKIIDEHKNDPVSRGMGLTDLDKELDKVSKYFLEELKKIKSKYGIE